MIKSSRNNESSVRIVNNISWPLPFQMVQYFKSNRGTIFLLGFVWENCREIYNWFVFILTDLDSNIRPVKKWSSLMAFFMATSELPTHSDRYFLSFLLILSVTLALVETNCYGSTTFFWWTLYTIWYLSFTVPHYKELQHWMKGLFKHPRCAQRSNEGLGTIWCALTGRTYG